MYTPSLCVLLVLYIQFHAATCNHTSEFVVWHEISYPQHSKSMYYINLYIYHLIFCWYVDHTD